MADETKIIRLVIDSSKAVDGGRAAQRALEQIERQTGTMAQALDRMEQSLGRVGGFLKAHLVLALTEAAARLAEMGRQSFEAAAGLEEMAQQVGLTARELQGMQFIGVQSGVKLEEISNAASKFSVKMGEAASGSKDVVEALKGLGVQNLDLNGKLRPTADLMAEVAQRILEIEDPARRSAAMVDFFGKTGTKFLPVLEDMAKGLGSASQQAQKFGAMIGDDTIKRLDELAGAMDRGRLRTRAFLAEGLVAIADWVERNKETLKLVAMIGTGGLGAYAMDPGMAGRHYDVATTWLGDAHDTVRKTFDEMVGAATGFVAQFLEAFRALPEQLGGLMVDGMNVALVGLEAGLNKLNAGLAGSWIGRQVGMTGNAIDLGRVGGGGASLLDYGARIAAAGNAAEQQFRAGRRDYAAERTRQRQIAGMSDMEAAEAAARRGDIDMSANLLTGRNSAGAGTSAVKGAGEAQADKYDKLINQLTLAADAQDRMTAAALRGDVALEQQKVAVDASQKALDIFGKVLDANDPRLTRIEELMRRIGQGKAAEAFALATTELEKQNVILEAQNRLLNEAPEIQARELAIIKARQEAEKGGAAITAEMVDARRRAIEANETLKLQAEQMKRADELWTAPLKQALQNIQTAGADAWQTILETGEFSFRSLGDVFTKTLRRMAAEFLALATIRPVMSLLVSTAVAGGIVSPATAAQSGFPLQVSDSTSGGGFSLPQMPTGGGGLGSIFNSGASGGGWLGRQLGGIGSWLGSPIVPPSGATLPGGAYGPAGPGLGGLTWGQGIGGLASIGMGAYRLFKGGGNTASTIGSIGQIAGGAMMMIPGLQPFGAALSMISSIVPGLFGDSGPKTPPQPSLQYSMGNFYSEGGSSYLYGGDGGGKSVGTDLMARFRSAGLRVVPGNLYGGELASGVDHTLNGNQWSDRPYTQTGLITPGGALERLTYNDSSMNVQQASEYLLAQVFKANVLRGGVSGAGAGLTAGLQTINPASSEDLDRVVALGTAYDKLGKAINPAKDALDRISASFDDLKSFATEAGLAMEPINEEMKKQSKRSAQDFIDGMLDPLAVQMRAFEDEREAALESARWIKDNVTDVYVDLDRIVDFYGQKRLALEDQFYGGAITNLENLISRLTYGDLANASPTLQLTGTKAAYDTVLAGARAGDAMAITNYAGYAENYLGIARQNFASGPEYEAIRRQILANSVEVSGVVGGGATTSAGQAQASTQQNQQVAQLTAMVQQLTQLQAESQNQVAELTAQMRRLASAGGR